MSDRIPKPAGLLALAAVIIAVSAGAQTGYPMLTSVYPVGLQRGATAEVTVTGTQNFAGAYGTLFDGPGVTAAIVAPNPAPEAGKAVNSVTLKVTVAADAPLGPQEFRVATPRGLSSVGVLVIGSEPQLLEKEGNNTPKEANPISLPAGVNGRIQQGEDTDCYRFTVNAGDEVVFSCISARLQDRIHDLSPGSGGTHSDPILTLTDASDQELASSDDYYGPDPLLAHRFEKAGDYVLQVRDVRYQGNAGWTYAVTCTKGPFLTAVYPMGVRAGEALSVEPVGFNLGGMREAKIEIPQRPAGPMDLQLQVGDQRTNPVPVMVSDLPQVLESGSNDEPAGATAAVVPGGFNGRIEAENDADCFRFKAAKGQAYTFEVSARRYGSSLDSYIEILDPAGKSVANNDDAAGKDSRLDWGCPADGDYCLRVTDLQRRGGPTYVYYVAATQAQPDFTLQADDDKALIGPGSGYAMYVIARRRNGFAGDIKLSVEGLPPGVTAVADRIPANMTQACVTLRAAPDTKPDFRRIRMFGTAEVKLPDGKVRTLRREVTPMEEIYTPGGGRATYAVETHAASVTEPSDVLLKLSATELTLKPGDTASFDVDVVRQKGYDKNVILDVYLRHLGTKYGDPLPPGVTLDEGASKTLLAPGETRGKITLRAAADAPEIQRLPIAVLGQVSINFVVKVSHASEPFYLSVKK